MATKFWIGNALPVAQRSRITAGGTWATNDTITLTINERSIVITVGSSTDLTTIVSLIEAAWNGEEVSGTHTFSETGDNIPEFSEADAEADVANNWVNIDGDKGKPFALTIAKTSTSGTLTLSEPTAATGPNHVNNINNWNPNGVPVDGDDIVVENTNVSLLYGLTALVNVTPATLTIAHNFHGRIGLPATNVDNPQAPYPEHRQRFWQVGGSAAADEMDVDIGRGIGNGSPFIRLDFVGCKHRTLVHQTGPASEVGSKSIVIAGSDSANELNVITGSVGYHSVNVSGHLNKLTVGSQSQTLLEADVEIGQGVDLQNAAIVLNSGNLSITSGNDSGSIKVFSGVLRINSLTTVSAPIGNTYADIEVFGGEVHPVGTGTITSLAVTTAGTADFRNGSKAWTVTSASIWEGGALLDPYKTVTWTNPIVTFGDLDKMRLDLGFSLSITVV